MPQKTRITQALITAVFVASALQASAFDRQLTPTLAAETSHGAHATKMTDGSKLAIGDLMLLAPFARATLPNQPVAGAFLSIMNSGATDDVLVSVESTIARRGEIHEMKMSGDTMKMRPLPDGLVIPAGETVELKPGGYHLMLMDLHGPLVEGETFDATLEFEGAGKVTVTFIIMGKGAKAMDHANHGS